MNAMEKLDELALQSDYAYLHHVILEVDTALTDGGYALTEDNRNMVKFAMKDMADKGMNVSVKDAVVVCEYVLY